MNQARPLIANRLLARSIIAAALCSLPFVPSARGFVEVERGELLFEATARLISDSNIYGNSLELDDTVLNFEPALVYLRKGGQGEIQFRGGVSFERYSDLDAEDTNNSFARLDISLPTASTSPLQGDFYLDYFKGRRVDYYLNDRIDLETSSLGGMCSYRFGGRTSLRFGADYSATYPDNLAKSNSRSFTVGGGYEIRTGVSAFADYRYRRSKSEADPVTLNRIGQKDHAVFVGLTGDLNTTLKGTAAAGFQRTSVDSNDPSGDANLFVADVSLEWTPRQRTTVFIRAMSDTTLTNAIQTVERMGAEIGVEQAIGQTLKGSASLEWYSHDFRGTSARGDDILAANFSLSYEPSKYLSAGAEIMLYTQDSNSAVADFDRSTFGLFGRFTY
jgi:hypothetical protein